MTGIGSLWGIPHSRRRGATNGARPHDHRRRVLRCAAARLVLVAAAMSTVAPAPSPALVLSCDPLDATFEVLPGVLFNNRAHGVSRDGRIVAGFTENGSSGRPLLWDALGNRQLLSFSGADMHAFEISDPDPTTGERVVTGLGGTGTYVRWVGGMFEDTGILADGPGVSFLSTQWDAAVGATPDGQTIVGSEGSGSLGTPFVFDVPTGVLQPLVVPEAFGGATGVSDDGSVISGYVRVGIDRVPALWVDGVLQMLPLGIPCRGARNFGRALDVSADGTVAVGRVQGCRNETLQTTHAAVWRGGQLTELPMDLPSPFGESAPSAISVSPDGRYVVGTQNRTRGPAFIWDERNGLRDLAVVLARDYGLVDEMAAWSLIAATDVATLPDGSIVIVGYMWPTARAAGPGNFQGFRVTLEATCPDDDLDGLCNEWEEQKYIDVDCDGVKETPGTDLELRGADPQHKDIFVEIDYIEGTTMPPGAIVDVERAFAVVPNNLIGNPDGKAGIRLVLDEDDPLLPRPINPSFPLRREWVDSTVCGMPDQFAMMKDAWFGTSLERGSPELLAVKRRLFRYMIIGGQFDVDAIGKGAIFGPDAVVAEEALQSRDLAASSVMHELGHTLGLHHGGPRDVVNYKPNYHSVMNYTWTAPGSIELDDRLGTKAYAASWVLDFARTAFSFRLDEAAGLDETRGLGGPLAHTLHVVPVGPLQGTPQNPLALPRAHFEAGGIDFDRDGGALENLSAPTNVNEVNTADTRAFEITQRLELLVPRADWPFVADTLAATFEHPNWTSTGPASCVGLLIGPDEVIREPSVAELRGLSVDMPLDCNGNGLDDTDELLAGTATDDDGDFILDECEPLAGDCDGDQDVDEEDRQIFVGAFGRTEGEPEYLECADLDRDRDVTLVDYQAWVAAYEAGQQGAGGCGSAGGGEAALLVAVWAWQRGRVRRKRGTGSTRVEAA